MWCTYLREFVLTCILNNTHFSPFVPNSLKAIWPFFLSITKNHFHFCTEKYAFHPLKFHRAILDVFSLNMTLTQLEGGYHHHE